MRCIREYSVKISLSELFDFLNDEYVELLCKRLHVSREDVSNLFVFDVSQNPNAIMITHMIDGIEDEK